VKVCNIGFEHIGREAVLNHQFFVGVTGGAQIGRIGPEGSRVCRAQVVRAVAVNTGRRVGVAFLQERAAVRARTILLMLLLMAFAARMNGGTQRQADLSRIGLLNIVAAVAVTADGRVLVAGRYFTGVHAA